MLIKDVLLGECIGFLERPMDQNNIHNEHNRTSSRWLIALVLFLAIGGFFLLSEH